MNDGQQKTRALLFLEEIKSKRMKDIFKEDYDDLKTSLATDIETTLQNGIFLTAKYSGRLSHNYTVLHSIIGEVKEHLTIPKDINEIFGKAISNKSNLKYFEALDGLKIVRSFSFDHCKELESVIFPKSLKFLEDIVFVECNQLKEISLPGKCEIGKNILSSYPENLMVHFYDFPIGDKSGLLGKREMKDYQYFGQTLDYHFNIIKYSYYGADRNSCGTIYNIPFKKIPFCESLDDFIVLLSRKNEFREMIDFSILEKEPILDKYNEEDKRDLINYCNEVIKTLFAKTSTDKIYSDILTKMNYKKFINNMKSMQDGNFSIKETCEILLNNNDVLSYMLSSDIDDALKNYNELLNMKILTSKVMNSFFFDGLEVTSLQDLKKYYDSNHKLPELFNALLFDNSNFNAKQELKDRILYISAMHWLEKGANEEKVAKRMMYRNLFSNIVEQDKENIIKHYRYYNRYIAEQESRLEGIYYPIYKKMSGINEDWFNQFFHSIGRPEFNKFMESLVTIKKWDTYSSEVERATNLKNEIVGRLLYADLLAKFWCKPKGIKNGSSLVKAYKSDALKKLTIPFPILLKIASNPPEQLFNIDIDFLKELSTSLTDANEEYQFIENGTININNMNSLLIKNNDMILKALLAIDPYSVEMLKGLSIQLTDELNKTKSISVDKFAQQYGYYIAGDNDNTEKSFIEYINNDIKIPMMQREDKELYLKELKENIKRFVASYNEADLYRTCNMFDFYLRGGSKQFEVERLKGNKFSEDAKVVFDETNDTKTSFSNMGRALYCMFNLNRLAKCNYDWQVEKCDENRLSVGDMTEDFDVIRRKVNILEKYKMSLDFVHSYYQVKYYGIKDRSQTNNQLEVKMFMTKTDATLLNEIDSIDLTTDQVRVTEYIDNICNPFKDRILETTVRAYLQRKINEMTIITDPIQLSEAKKDFKNSIKKLNEENLNDLDQVLTTFELSPNSLTITEKLELIDAFSSTFNFFNKNPEDFDMLKTAVFEKRVAYECKRTIADAAMKKFGLINQQQIVTSVAFSDAEKINKFHELGYAIEVQKDDAGELVLACYCKGCIDSFSIHLKDLSPQIEEELRKNYDSTANHLIKTTKIRDRLRIYTDEDDVDIKPTGYKDAKLSDGFNSIDNLSDNQIHLLTDQIAYANAEVFGVNEIINKVIKNDNSLKVVNEQNNIQQNSISSTIGDLSQDSSQTSPQERFNFIDKPPVDEPELLTAESLVNSNIQVETTAQEGKKK